MEQCDLRSIELDMADTISSLYEKYGYGDSAHAFNSLYIWAKDMDIKAYISPELYAAKLVSKGENTWFSPVGCEEEKKSFIADRLREKNLVFRYMTKEDAKFLNENFPGAFEIKPAINDSEYVYDRDTIENLPGKGLSRKRRYVKQLKKEHTFEIRKISPETLPDIRYILGIWRRNKDYDPDCNDQGALEAMLSSYSDMNIDGVVIYMDNAPCSVAAGYYLSGDTVDACLQKSAINIYGLQYFVRQVFSSSFPEQVKFYNYEEDLGIEGLRQAKEFMHPFSMVDMYTGKQI